MKVCRPRWRGPNSRPDEPSDIGKVYQLPPSGFIGPHARSPLPQRPAVPNNSAWRPRPDHGLLPNVQVRQVPEHPGTAACHRDHIPSDCLAQRIYEPGSIRPASPFLGRDGTPGASASFVTSSHIRARQEPGAGRRPEPVGRPYSSRDAATSSAHAHNSGSSISRLLVPHRLLQGRIPGRFAGRRVGGLWTAD